MKSKEEPSLISYRWCVLLTVWSVLSQLDLMLSIIVFLFFPLGISRNFSIALINGIALLWCCDKQQELVEIFWKIQIFCCVGIGPYHVFLKLLLHINIELSTADVVCQSMKNQFSKLVFEILEKFEC